MSKGTTVRMWRRALIVLTVLVVVGFSVIIIRLINLQLVNGEMLTQMATDQQLKDTKISAQRGTIYDCNKRPLAQSATVWTVVLEPAYLKDDEKRNLVADKLSEILELDRNDIFEKSKKKSFYTVLKRKINTDIKDKIVEFQKEYKIKSGIRLIEDYKRYYPYGESASAVIGFFGADNQGLAGIQSYYNEYLTGEAGRLVIAKNAIGTDMPFDDERLIPAQNGYNLVLEIDEVIQHFLEKNLEEGIKNYDVKNRAVAIAMDVNTGAILGMAVKGGFDLNSPFEIKDEATKASIDALPEEERSKARSEALEKIWRNKAISDTYMPGSVFKMVTASMGFEENLIDEKTNFNCGGSIIPFQGARPIKCRKSGGHGSQDFLQALCNSCNPAFVTLGQMIGPEKFYKYYTGFGFTEKTGIDLPGEANGIFFSKDGSMAPMDLAVASFGQNFSITPIQMITAAAVVANGGNLVKPHIVKQVVDTQGNIIKSSEKIIKRRVISEDTSRRIAAMLQINATSGTAKSGYVAGYRVAGKTGTSQKIGQSGPDGMDYIASYCGFAPADNPQVALLVFYDTPKGTSYYGGVVAGPTFCKTMQDILPYLGIERKYTDEELANLDISTPFLVGSKISEAKEKAQSLGFSPVVYGEGETVVSQIPEVSTKMQKGGTIILYTEQNSNRKKVIVPNLIGMGLASANKAALDVGLNVDIKGASADSEITCVNQSIPAGTSVEQGTVIKIEFITKEKVQ